MMAAHFGYISETIIPQVYKGISGVTGQRNEAEKRGSILLGFATLRDEIHFARVGNARVL